jgi:formyl-CoA transferase
MVSWMSEHLALENLVILDLTRVLAGPFCTMMLADMGAKVIKIENPKGGDDTRGYPPFREKNLNGERESLYFANINRNKQGITLNLKAEEGKEIFRKLVEKADVVVENYRPGVMERLGLGYEELKKINPRIIYGEVSGFGSYGPYSSRPGYDILAQAMGGMMSITGPKGGEPTRAGSALGDILGGLHLCIGILAAVNARNITGEGQKVDISLMDSMIAATENTALKYMESGVIPPRMGNRYAAVSPYDGFRCKDGTVIIAAGNQKLFEKLFVEVLNKPDYVTDPRFLDMPGRLKYQDDLQLAIEDFLKDYTMEEATELLLAHGIPAGPILSIDQIIDNEQTKAREMFIETEHPTLGKVTVNGCAVKLMDTKPGVRTPAPALGQNNADVLASIGYDVERIAALKEQGVL